MSPSAPFIRRPVATTLIALAILMLGALSFTRMPIASLPTVDRPTIGVWAGLPGASADTIAAALAEPLERQLGTIPGILEMTSFSAPGGVSITIQFALERDIDAAAGAVQAALKAAGPDLPRDLPQPPVYWKANPAGFAVIALALTSDVLDPSEVYDTADTIVAQKIAQLPGVARVSITGAERSAVRITADPRRLAGLGVPLEALRQVVAAASQNLPKGGLASGSRAFTINANDQLMKAADYREVIVAWRPNGPVRLGDVARVEDDVINRKLAGWYGEQRAVIIYVYKQVDANVVATVDAVKALLPELGPLIPAAIKVRVNYDRTTLIRASIAEVERTIAIAIGLVVGVIALFLRRLAATAIPILTIPIALGATLVAMDGLGYSLDNLTLMAITIAVGFVVDDAVIVVENTIRRMDAGEDATTAALASASQIGFTILAITAALIGALIPILFMPDVVGRYFREFGLTLVAAVVASAGVALTVTPMLCARLLPVRVAAVRSPTAGRLQRAYGASLALALRHPWLVVAVLVLATASSALIYLRLPKGFMPTQDTGILSVRTVTTANVSFTAMEQLQRTVARAILDDKDVESLSSYIGTNNGSTLSNGYLTVSLKPLESGRPPIGEVIGRLRARLAPIDGVRTFFSPFQDLSLGVQNSASRYQYTLTGDDPAALYRWAEILRLRMIRMAEITDIISDAEQSGLEAGVAIDRARAAMVGVTPRAIDDTLYDAFGQRQIRTIYLPFNYTRVVLEIEPEQQMDPAALTSIYVPGSNNAQVPLAALTRPTREHAAMWLRHTDQFTSVTLSFDLRPGVALGSAITAIREAEAVARLPEEIKAGFKGEAGEQAKSGLRQLLLLLGAVFAIYVALGILYESTVHPFTILTTLPSATLGALAALSVTGSELSLMASIACILVIGMVMKNAIMVVDFAIGAERQLGLSPQEAAYSAATARVRPIVMTSLVAALSALPLALGNGPGHELRAPLGIASVGGLVVAQLLTLYTTPVIFMLVARAAGRQRSPTARL